eukprot:622494-Pyramimonas_sp.AAC.1
MAAVTYASLYSRVASRPPNVVGRPWLEAPPGLSGRGQDLARAPCQERLRANSGREMIHLAPGAGAD